MYKSFWKRFSLGIRCITTFLFLFLCPCLRVQLFKLHVIFLQDDDSFFPAKKKIPRLYSNIIFNASNDILCLKQRHTTNTKYILQDCKQKINT